MAREKYVKAIVNKSAEQCRLSIPKASWGLIPTSGWYLFSDNNGVLTYTPTDKPRKVPIPTVNKGRTYKQGVEANKQLIESNEMDYFKPTIDPKQNASDALDYAELSSVPQQHLFDEGDVWSDEEVST